MTWSNSIKKQTDELIKKKTKETAQAAEKKAQPTQQTTKKQDSSFYNDYQAKKQAKKSKTTFTPSVKKTETTDQTPTRKVFVPSAAKNTAAPKQRFIPVSATSVPGNNSNYRFQPRVGSADNTFSQLQEVKKKKTFVPSTVQGKQKNSRIFTPKNTEKSTSNIGIFGGSTFNVKNQLQSMNRNGNVDLLHRPVINADRLEAAGWGKQNKGTATVYSSSYSNADGTRTVLVTPILKNGRVLTPAELQREADSILSGQNRSSETLLGVFEGKDSIKQANAYGEKLHQLHQEYYKDQATTSPKMTEKDLDRLLGEDTKPQLQNPRVTEANLAAYLDSQPKMNSRFYDDFNKRRDMSKNIGADSLKAGSNLKRSSYFNYEYPSDDYKDLFFTDIKDNTLRSDLLKFITSYDRNSNVQDRNALWQGSAELAARYKKATGKNFDIAEIGNEYTRAQAAAEQSRRDNYFYRKLEDYYSRAENADFDTVAGKFADPTYYGKDKDHELAMRKASSMEQKIYHYLRKTEGDDAAEDFLDRLELLTNQRVMQEVSEPLVELGENHRVFGGVGNAVVGLGKGLAYVDNAGQALGQALSNNDTYRPYNPYTPMTAAVHFSNALKSGVTKDLTGAEKVAADLLLNVGENTVRLALGPAGLYVMGAGAAGETAVNQGLKGETNAGRAFATGTAYGAVEIATEKLPLDNLLKILNSPPTNIKQAIVTLLKNAAVEGGEEAISNIADNIADKIINGDKSEFEQYTNALIQNGISEDKATITAFLKFYVSDTVTDAAQGAAAGALMSGGTMAVSSGAQYYDDVTNIGQEMKNLGVAESVVNEGLARDAQTGANRYAQRMQSKLDSGKDLTDWNVGRQYLKNVNAIQSEEQFINSLSGIVPTEVTDRLYDDKGNELNGQYIGGEQQRVGVSANGDMSIPAAAKHEFTHAFKQIAPTAYIAFENYVINAAMETNAEAVNNRLQFLKENYGYSDEVAREEIAAELTGTFNTKAAERIANGNVTLADNIVGAIRTAKAQIRTAYSNGNYENSKGVQLTFEQLNNAEKLWNKALSEAAENGGQVQNERNVRNSPIEQNSKGKYVQADRQAITSDNPDDWEGQIYDYINDKIRNGQDVVIPTDDGDNLTITEKTAWKMGYRNRVNDNGTVRPYNNTEYRTKINAAAHIDELAEISKRSKQNYPDTKNHDFAQGGFNYRTAYFRDLDGQYYKLTISVGENTEGKTVYNIGNIKKVPFPDSGSKASSSNTARGERNYDGSVSPSEGANNSFIAGNAVTSVDNNIISENEPIVKKSVKENTGNQTKTDSFKNWFGDWENDPDNASKVVNEDGTPKVVYHGTTNQETTRKWNDKTHTWDNEYSKFTVFKSGQYEGHVGHFFNSDEDNAGGYGDEVYAVYLNMRNPLEIDCNNSNYDEITFDGRTMDTYEWAEYAKKQGYDGVIFKNIVDGADYSDLGNPTTNYVVFNSTQIKSATDNIGTFDPNNADIRYSIKEDADDATGDKKVSKLYENTMHKNVYTSEFISEADRRKPEFMYEGISNKETYEAAQAELAEHGADKVLADLAMKNREWSADDVAKVLALVAKYQTEGNHEKAVDIYSMFRERATKAGQATQAWKILNKLTPEGQLIDFKRNADGIVEKQIKRKSKDEQRQIRAELEEAREKDSQRKNEQWYHESRYGEEGANPKDIIDKLPDLPDKEIRNPNGEQREKSFVDEVLDNHNIQHLPSDCYDAVANLLELIDRLNTKDDLINLILQQSKARKTASHILVKKALQGENIEFLKDAAVQQVFGFIADRTPSTVASKISTFQAMAQLLNAKTMKRNILSNMAFDITDTISTDIGSMVDGIMGVFTGQRTVGTDRGWLEKGRFRAGLGNAKQSYIDIALAVNHDSSSKYGTPTSRRTFKGRFTGGVERALSYGLTVTDEFQKGAISHSEKRAMERLKKSGFNDAEIELITEQTEKYRTFQDNTKLAQFLTGLKDIANIIGFGDKVTTSIRGKEITTHEFGVGDIICKYTSVPGNLVTRGVEYSPLGYAKALYLIGKAGYNKAHGVSMSAQTQRNIALTLARPMTGMGLIAAFYMLAKAGIFVGDRDDEEKELKNMRNAEGQQDTQMNLSAFSRWIKSGFKDSGGLQNGDVLTTIGFLEPLNTNMATGAAIAQMDNGIKKLANWVNAAGAKTFDQVLDLSTMSTIRDIFNTLRYDDDAGVPEVLWAVGTSGATGFVPAVLRQTGSFADKASRYPYREKDAPTKAMEQIKTAFPIARETVAERITPFGETKTNSTGNRAVDFYNSFFNPGYTNIYQTTDVSDEVYRLADQSTDALPHTPKKSFTYDKQKYTLYGKDYEKYSRLVGQNTLNSYRDVIKSDEYKKMSDEERIDALKKAADKAEKDAQAEFAGSRDKVHFRGTEPHTFKGKREAEVAAQKQKIAEEQKKQQYQDSITERYLQGVADDYAKVDEQNSGFEVSALQINDIRSTTIDGKEYKIEGETEAKIISAANDIYYSNVEKLMNNEINIEDILGYTQKGKAHTSKQADGQKVALTGKMYNADGTPRFDATVTKKIINDVKYAAKDDAIAQYKDEIAGSSSTEETASPETSEPTKVSFVPKPSGGSSGSSYKNSQYTFKGTAGGGSKKRSGLSGNASRSGSSYVNVTPASSDRELLSFAAASILNSQGIPNIGNNVYQIAARDIIKNGKVQPIRSNKIKPIKPLGLI